MNNPCPSSSSSLGVFQDTNNHHHDVDTKVQQQVYDNYDSNKKREEYDGWMKSRKRYIRDWDYHHHHHNNNGDETVAASMMVSDESEIEDDIDNYETK